MQILGLIMDTYPIYLIQERIASKAIALDVKKGPLERARMHIVGHGLKGQIETRLSDGLRGSDTGGGGYDDRRRNRGAVL